MVLFGLRLNTDDDFKPGVELQKGKCTVCHVGSNFTDEQFHNLGIGWDSATKKHKDIGRWAPVPIGAKSDADLGQFKTPTCRDVELSAPYMHDGSLKTLEEVVEHYDKGGNLNPSLDPEIKPLHLTAQESADLVAFMKALTGEHKSLEELIPTLPPGPDGSSPDPAQRSLRPPRKSQTRSTPRKRTEPRLRHESFTQARESRMALGSFCLRRDVRLSFACLLLDLVLCPAAKTS